MRAKWLGVTVLAALAAGCGEGRLIVVVDVHSFVKGTGEDTIPYFIPMGGASVSNTPRPINLPGAGSSIVDSVKALGTLDLANTGGTGTIGLQLYLAADSAATFSSNALALDVPATTVSGAGTFPATITGRLNPGVDSLFTANQMWFRFQATGQNGSLTPVQGNAILTSLYLTVYISDKFF